MKKSWRIKNTQEHHTGVQCLKQMLCIHQIKIFGINKLGTLLSSQTTDPPKHHPTGTPHKAAHHNRAIGKEELFLAAYRTVHTFRLSVSHPATQKTIHAPNPQRKSTPNPRHPAVEPCFLAVHQLPHRRNHRHRIFLSHEVTYIQCHVFECRRPCAPK